MQIALAPPGLESVPHIIEAKTVTFQVHDVDARLTEQPPSTMRDSLAHCLRSGSDFSPEIVAVADEGCACLHLPTQNALLGAVHVAFAQHVPLTLSPDMMWLAILQGFARHVSLHASELEGRLMKAPGKHVIRI